MAKAKGLSEADLQLWAAYAQSLRLLPGKERLRVAPEPAAPPPASYIEPAAPPPPKQNPRAFAAQVVVNMPPPGLDRASWQKFRAGRVRVARVLDLHCMTAARAHHATLSFILAAHTEQLRVVEIITGKGEVLLRELPHWLNSPQLRPLILALAHPRVSNSGSHAQVSNSGSHARDANTGALRILLRRARGE